MSDTPTTPTKSRIILSVEIPGILQVELEKESNLAHISKSDVVRKALYEYFKKQNELREFFAQYPTYDANRQRMEE